MCGGDVGEKVPGEAEDLLDEDAAQGDERGVLGHLIEIFHIDAEQGGVLASLGWDVVVVLCEVVGVNMVPTMG